MVWCTDPVVRSLQHDCSEAELALSDCVCSSFGSDVDVGEEGRVEGGDDGRTCGVGERDGR